MQKENCKDKGVDPGCNDAVSFMVGLRVKHFRISGLPGVLSRDPIYSDSYLVRLMA
jgi:hypothetical protein